MKTIFLLRHAKAAPGNAWTKDFDRELDARGVKEAARAGELMRRQDVHPKLILSSPAKRTQQTIELAIQSSMLEIKAQYDRRIYEASAGELLNVLTSTDENINEVLIVGHNPGIEELLRYLTNESRPMGTAALARVEIANDSWEQLTPGGGQLAWLIKTD